MTKSIDTTGSAISYVGAKLYGQTGAGIPGYVLADSLITKTQLSETTAIKALEIVPATAGFETFEVGFDSFPNSGAGTGTYNHGVWFGFNSGRHSNLPVTAGKPAIIMGFEDNYYDPIGDLSYGVEWYVEGWSPNGTTIPMSRPFYTRGSQLDDGTDWWITALSLGSSGSERRFSIFVPGSDLLVVTPVGVHCGVQMSASGMPVYANNAAAIAGGLTAGCFYRTGADPDHLCIVH